MYSAGTAIIFKGLNSLSFHSGMQIFSNGLSCRLSVVLTVGETFQKKELECSTSYRNDRAVNIFYQQL